MRWVTKNANHLDKLIEIIIIITIFTEVFSSVSDCLINLAKKRKENLSVKSEFKSWLHLSEFLPIDSAEFQSRFVILVLNFFANRTDLLVYDRIIELCKPRYLLAVKLGCFMIAPS